MFHIQAVKIQCAMRTFFARKRTRRMIEERARNARESRENESKIVQEIEQHEREDMVRSC